MRIVIDLDGTIAELKKLGQDYANLQVLDGAAKKIKELKDAGHYIILQTARHMKTCDGDQGKIMAKIGKVTLDWLEKNEIPYDEIYFGKPYADLYIDDLAHKFTNWENIKLGDFDEDRASILIPMAGIGSRFAKAGFDKPKPLIDVLGSPMVSWAMKSFDFLDRLKNYQIIFVILEEHNAMYKLEDKLKEIFGDMVKVVVAEKVTRGQAETCLLAKKYIDNYNKLFIYNCDTYSISKIWDLIEAENPDGILPVFEADDARYSFVKLDEYGYVCETAEKKVISNLATSGMYYFRRGADFVLAAENMLNNLATQNGEFYVAPCYNELLKSGKKIKTIMVDKNYVMGTPEELDAFIKNYRQSDPV